MMYKVHTLAYISKSAVRAYSYEKLLREPLYTAKTVEIIDAVNSLVSSGLILKHLALLFKAALWLTKMSSGSSAKKYPHKYSVIREAMKLFSV